MKICPHCGGACWDAHRHCPACGTDVADVPIAPPEADPLVGMTLAQKYVLRDVIGSGGMGRVYRAEQRPLGKTVAVKVLSPQLSSDPTSVGRFHQEARAASRLSHPNAIAVIDFGQADGGLLYLVMEYVKGRTLAAIMAEVYPVEPTRIVTTLAQILAALDEAHALGVIHRDLKPENILVSPLRDGSEHVKVLDFGLAKLAGEPGPGHTMRGFVAGTPAYMSPEQARGDPLDGRSDVYAVGIVLYELLAGCRPFSGAAAEILSQHLSAPPPPPSRTAPAGTVVPTELEVIALRALAKSADDRYPSAGAMREALLSCLGHVATERGERACSGCGSRVPERGQFCPNCGETVPRDRSSGNVRRVELPRSESRGTISVEPTSGLRGRDRELARLTRVLDGQGPASVALVGPAGIGKTALAMEFARQAVARGFTIHSTGPDPAAAATPWLPVRRMIASVLQIDPTPNAAAVEKQARAWQLGDEIAGLLELFGLPGALSALDFPTRRREALAATLRTLRVAASSHPPARKAVLVFRDLDEYDRPSREIVERLIEVPGEGQLVVLVTARAAEDPLPDATLFAELTPLPAADGLALAHTLAESASKVYGTPPAEASLTASVEQAHGNPLTIEQRVLASVEGISLDEDASIVDVATRRVAGLARVGAHVLAAGAVYGDDVTPAALLELAELGDDAVPEIERLVVARFLTKEGERLSFAHPVLRAVAYAGIPVDVRQRLHARALAVSERHGQAAAVCANHAYNGIPDRRALAWLDAAAEEARRGFDDHGAALQLRRAVEIARRLVAAGEDDAETLLGKYSAALGESLRHCGDLTAAEGVLMEALDRCDVHVIEARLRRSLAHVALAYDDPRRAEREITAAIGAAMRAGDRELLVLLYVDFARSVSWRERIATEVPLLEEGVDVCTAGEGPRADQAPAQFWRLLLRLSDAYRDAGLVEKARSTAEEGLLQAERAGNPAALIRASVQSAAVARVDGDSHGARAHLQRGLGLARKLADRRTVAEILIALADEALQSGQVRSAREPLQEAQGLAAAVEWPEGMDRCRERLEVVARTR